VEDEVGERDGDDGEEPAEHGDEAQQAAGRGDREGDVGAGVQQAILVSVFGTSAAAYSVGQQIALAVFVLGLGFFSIVVIFRFRSFKEVIRAGQQSRAAEAEAAAAPG